MSDNMISIVSVMHGESEFIPLILNNFNNFTNKDNLELIIIDDGKEDLSEHFTDENIQYIHLSEDDINQFLDMIESKSELEQKHLFLFYKKRKVLPNGFKRDYACGLSSHDFIFHMNIDCIYNPKTIQKRFDVLQKTNSDCIYSDTTLCYDIYNQSLYKSTSEYKIYESTVLHKREFWKRRGFNWSSAINEAAGFYYNNGPTHKQTNYYDIIQLLTIHNINKYKPISITLENHKIEIPEVVKEIKINDHPFVKYISELYSDTVNILGLNSQYLEDNSEDNWEINNMKDWKQTKLAKQVKALDKEFNVLLFGSKHPAWDLFKHVNFDIIFLETNKNYEQMISIIDKTQKYVFMNGIFILKEFLEN